jgi:Tfp pilus assembly protein PilV
MDIKPKRGKGNMGKDQKGFTVLEVVVVVFSVVVLGLLLFLLNNQR